MRSRLVLAVLAGLAVVLLAAGTTWALLGAGGAGEGRVPGPIDVPARETPTDAPTDAPGTPQPTAPESPTVSAPAPPPTDVVPPPPLGDGGDDDGDDDGGGDVDDDGDD